MTIKPTSDAVAVTRDDAIKFLETAVRNWGRVHFDQDGLEDVRVELERFAARHRLASTRPMTEDVAGLVEEVGRIPVRTEIVNVDTGETGAQSVVLSLDLRDRILTALKGTSDDK